MNPGGVEVSGSGAPEPEREPERERRDPSGAVDGAATIRVLVVENEVRAAETLVRELGP